MEELEFDIDELSKRMDKDREKLEAIRRRICRDKFRGILVIKLDLACKVKALKFRRGKPWLQPGEVQYYSDGCIVIYPEDACLRHEAILGDILVIKLDFANKVKELSVRLGELIWHMPEEAQFFSGGCIIIPEES